MEIKLTLPVDASNLRDEVTRAHNILHDRKGGAHKNWVGWMDLPSQAAELVADVKAAAHWVRKNCDALLVLGTGGSFFGAAAVIDLLRGVDNNLWNTPQVFFFGHALDAQEMANAVKLVETKSVAINIISKSGTTLEPAMAFEALFKAMSKKYPAAQLQKRIICTTDKEKGTLKQFANKHNLKTFVVPDDVGGRYSVLSPVGLFPIAVAGVDVTMLLEGAGIAAKKYGVSDVTKNDCYRYAAARLALARKKYALDLFCLTNPNATKFGNWLCQLFAESEGKGGHGVFPSVAVYPRDLHSIGQFIQDGSKILFETFIHFSLEDNTRFNAVNNIVYEAAKKAHTVGKTPIISIETKKLDEQSVGYLIYFFELACAMYCVMLGVDPFNQPGVEEYKKHTLEALAKL